MKLYKYMTAVTANALINEGEIRIGTLAWYQEVEKHAKLIGDAREGRRLIALAQKGGPWSELPEMEKAVIREMVPSLGPDQPLSPTIRIEHNMFITEVKASNCLLYCMSTELSREARGEYDTAVEISDHDRFLKVLSNVLAEYCGGGVNVAAGPVDYEPLMVDALTADNLDPVFTKTMDHEVQREYRARWIPIDPKTQAFRELPPKARSVTMCIPDLREFVSIVEVPE